MGSPQRVSTEINEDAWMVRPCELYKEEYRDCKSFRSRFHQLFTKGEQADCQQWKQDYENCMIWAKSGSDQALSSILINEKRRVYDRVASVVNNNVWEIRKEPPTDWNDPLPKHLEDLRKAGHMASLSQNEKGAKKGNETTTAR